MLSDFDVGSGQSQLKIAMLSLDRNIQTIALQFCGLANPHRANLLNANALDVGCDAIDLSKC